MAKGQRRSNKEIRKPKMDKPAAKVEATLGIGIGKQEANSGSGKKKK